MGLALPRRVLRPQQPAIADERTIRATQAAAVGEAHWLRRPLVAFALFVELLSSVSCSKKAPEELKLLNVSYDPTREFYVEFNALFSRSWLAQNGQSVKVQQSHGGSGKQARAVMDGLQADVVTLALEHDVTTISRRGLIAPSWKARLPNGSAPYTSIIVLVVRVGNPKQIRDWNDLARPGVGVITPNPKTGGGARLNYLAAWAYGLRANRNDEAKTRQLLEQIYRNVLVMDSGARGSSTTFIEHGIGDVLISWENEALMALDKFGRERFEVVIPSLTLLAEPTVAVVDRYAEKHGTTALATAYLQQLYSTEGQELIAKHHFRPRNAQVLARHAAFAVAQWVTVEELGGWDTVQTKHFADGGLFDGMFQRNKP